MAFDARLRWVDGDASKAPRKRGRGGFGGEYARRPRPAPPRETPPGSAESTGGESGGVASAPSVVGGGVIVGGGGGPVGGVLATRAAAGGVGETGEASDEELLLERAEPATVFCDTEIKVQVLLPPPYNTLLPWRLVRALLGKLLSIIVAYVLPRFLEVMRSVCVWTRVGRGNTMRVVGTTSSAVDEIARLLLLQRPTT